MQTIRTIQSLRDKVSALKRRGRSVGFVPTMGCLHCGHASLLKRCRKENDIVILSIFVNPTQFGPKEDFKKYPRTWQSDLRIAQGERTDIIFYPSANEIYPPPALTRVVVDKISDVLCGRSRPGHFSGVSTVVAKLLNIVQPDRIYLGEKDAQQIQVLKIMLEDLNFPTRIITCPTVREKDGLACSSRNRYLTARQRQEAPVLYQSLVDAKKKILKGERRSARVLKDIRKNITQKTSAQIEYVECVERKTLSPLRTIHGETMIALAAKFGNTRLIDNVTFRLK